MTDYNQQNQPPSVQAGWYPDPSGDSTRLRYWDGGIWTESYQAVPVAQAAPSTQAAQTQPQSSPLHPGQNPPLQTPQYQQPQQSQQYAQPYATQAKEPGSGAATASLVCGIIGIFIAGLILGIVAIVQGVKAKRLDYQGGKATAGIVLGVVDLIGWAAIVISYIT